MEQISQESLDLLEAIMDEAIPRNSESLIVDEVSSRFNGAAWFNAIKDQTVLLAGLGGIGSWTALLLSRLQIGHLYLFDDDRVERHNISGQFYSTNQDTNYKVIATSSNLGSFSNFYNYYSVSDRYEESTSTTSDIMICGFDNMQARKVFFNKWLNRAKATSEENRAKMLFIDGRLEAEQFQVFAITGNDENSIKKYQEEFLFEDSEVEEAPCNYKQTSFISNMIASYMVNIFVNFIANSLDPIFPREVPFFTSYRADTMFLKIIS